MKKSLYKLLFFALWMKPLAFILIGLNIVRVGTLPTEGPSVVIANHNSHLDALILMSLYPLRIINQVRPVAAADYFFKNKYLKWFATRCLDIVPIDRNNRQLNETFEICNTALNNGQILLLFPEGSRGNPEELGKIKKGLFYMLKDRADLACLKIVPVFMYGLGKALPRGEALLVPFNVDVIIGKALVFPETSKDFVHAIGQTFQDLQSYCLHKGVFQELKDE
ncbi:MAG: 1-acyl-sn-glycerol-3-phosphate acyltransferase [Vampirovibrionales bacterium]|jgi:1-acyl-sn-glycerol-3-phosphate acyltransferase|nr:1-acyl-sn-glycerol-3-phosphate acyltransferase [Vampirovibrionales bacterium]